jgi:hypothetical protein
MNTTPDISKVKAELKAENTPAINHPSKDSSGRMSVQNIVLESLRRHGKEKSFHKTYAALHHLLDKPEYRIMRQGNTLFFIHIIGKGECNFALIDADSPKNMLRNAQGFFEAMKKAGYKKGHGETKNPRLISAIQNMGIPVQETGKSKSGLIKFVVEV